MTRNEFNESQKRVVFEPCAEGPEVCGRALAAMPAHPLSPNREPPLNFGVPAVFGLAACNGAPSRNLALLVRDPTSGLLLSGLGRFLLWLIAGLVEPRVRNEAPRASGERLRKIASCQGLTARRRASMSSSADWMHEIGSRRLSAISCLSLFHATIALVLPS